MHLHPPHTPCTRSFAHQRLSWCIGGSNRTWCKCVCRHGSCLLRKEAARNAGTVQNGRKSQTCRQYSIQTWVCQIALFKGFPNLPHMPPPPPMGHTVGPNQATITTTTENPPIWRSRYRPQEKCIAEHTVWMCRTLLHAKATFCVPEPSVCCGGARKQERGLSGTHSIRTLGPPQ